VDIELTFGGRFNVLLKKFDFPSYNVAVAMTSVAKFAISLRTISHDISNSRLSSTYEYGLDV
jgi:hypothetical protein